MDIGRNVLKEYVPAVVYTLYDGYYIYSSYKNILDDKDSFDDKTTFKNNDLIDGLKPYIYYSCRYKQGEADVTITYSLDSYITIQGKLSDTQPINKSGYLLSGVGFNDTTGRYTYRGIEIEQENAIYENVYEENSNNSSGKTVVVQDESGVQYNPGKIVSYPCRKINGVKYYYNEVDDEVFSIINDVKYKQSNMTKEVILNNQNAVNYYKNAFEFKKFIEGNEILRNLDISNAVDKDGKKYTDYTQNPYMQYGKLFEELFSTTNYIEDENSNFNVHRLQVIKNSIESNLMIAIANYNKISISEVNFQMPKLQDHEWKQITDNISMITFLQGFNIGGKIYNGHSIISNNINEDFVSEDSIYIIDNGEYKRATDTTLINEGMAKNYLGMFNLEFERKTGQASYKKEITDASGSAIDTETFNKTIYYYPRNELGSYSSIVDANNNVETSNISKYIKNLASNVKGSQKYDLALKYYTALGREREGMYRVSNKLEEIQEGIKIQTEGGKYENDHGKIYDYFPPGYKLDGNILPNGNHHIVRE